MVSLKMEKFQISDFFEVALIVKAGNIMLVCKFPPDCICTMRKSSVLINKWIRIIIELLNF